MRLYVRAAAAGLLLLLIGGCSTEQTTSEEAAFDFTSDELCEWVTTEELSNLVTTAYQEHGATPIPDGSWTQVARDDAWGNATSGCLWGIPNGPNVELDFIPPDDAVPLEFTSHDGLSDGVGVNGLREQDDPPAFFAWLSVDGHDGQLEFSHRAPPGFDGDIEAILPIMDGLLREMGWIPVQ